ncbi:MAG TPA: cytidylate kinase-like family protein [Actinomycetales bacterium]|nr:cytidylate kinase-like family protein [Actinomycetales bacterium]
MTDTHATAGASLRPVVTMFETYGSGASYVGPRVAQALGVPFHAQAISSQEIEDAAARRESEGVLARLLNTIGGSYAGLDGPSVPMAQRDNHSLVLENTRIVLEEAREGGVIVGRNGALILASWPTALHVLLDGSLQQRIERAARESGIEIQRAAKRLKREEQVRADMSIEFYHWDPRKTERYDLMVNTGTMELDICVDIIVQAARVKAGLQQSPSP